MSSGLGIDDADSSGSAAASAAVGAAEAILAAMHVSGPAVAFFCFHCRACAEQRRLWEDRRLWPLAMCIPAVAFTYMGFYVGCLVTNKCMKVR